MPYFHQGYGVKSIPILSWFINSCGLWSEVESQTLNELAPNQEQVLKPSPTRKDYLEKHLQKISSTMMQNKMKPLVRSIRAWPKKKKQTLPYTNKRDVEVKP